MFPANYEHRFENRSPVTNNGKEDSVYEKAGHRYLRDRLNGRARMLLDHWHGRHDACPRYVPTWHNLPANLLLFNMKT